MTNFSGGECHNLFDTEYLNSMHNMSVCVNCNL